jgi:hypothetical protein
MRFEDLEQFPPNRPLFVEHRPVRVLEGLDGVRERDTGRPSRAGLRSLFAEDVYLMSLMMLNIGM